MNFITKHIAAYQIKKLALSSRTKQFIKIPQAKTIGIIFEVTDGEVFEIVKGFMQQLKQHTKNVHAIGYVDEKITPNYSYIKTDIDLFNKKELKNLYRPQNPYIKTFTDDEKDLLIDINVHQKIPLQYIAAASKAKCKVAMQFPQNEFMHDVLIATTPQQGVNFYLQQVIKYVS